MKKQGEYLKKTIKGGSLFPDIMRMSEAGSLNLSLGITGGVVGVSFPISGMSLM